MNKQSFCWHCGKKLNIARDGSIIFAEIADPIGNKHKVHKRCKDDALMTFKLEDIKTPFEIENPELFGNAVEGLDDCGNYVTFGRKL